MTTQQLDRRILDLRNLEREQAEEVLAARADLSNWQRALQVDVANNASPATIANSQSNIERARARLKAAEDALKATTQELKDLVARRQDIENAALEAIRNGVSPDKAYADAEAAQRNAQALRNIIKWVAIALGVTAVVYGIVVFFRWKKKSK